MADEKQLSDIFVVELKSLGMREENEVSRAITRVPRAMLKAKPEAYIPQIVSLGLYHHRTLKDDNETEGASGISLIEMYKLKSARVVLQAQICEGSTYNELIDRLYQNIIEHRCELEKFYNCNIEEQSQSQSVVGMIMIDALFLFNLLQKGFYFYDIDYASEHPPAMATVRCDIVKLENQIPLFLLREVEKALNIYQRGEFDDYGWRRILTHLSCFEVYGEYIKDIRNEQHLLGCMHTHVSSFLKIMPSGNHYRGPTLCQRISTIFGYVVAVAASVFMRHPAMKGEYDFLSRFNAEELLKAGIKIESFRDGKIAFDWNSFTLFLPRIIVTDTYTEVMLRILLALEFNGSYPEKHVTKYVELMDCLIDTPEDVRLLRDCGVIGRKSMLITDEYVADMWNGMCKPFYAGVREPPPELKSKIKEVFIRNYYRTKIITPWHDFRKEYLPNPWKAIGLGVGFLLLAFAVAQTVCLFVEYKVKTG